MKKILDFFARYKVYFAFLVLTAVSLALIAGGDANKIGGFRAAVIGSIGALQNAFSKAPNPIATKSENRALRRLNIELSEEVTRMRKAGVENKRLRAMLDLIANSERNYIVAQVVGMSSIEMRNYATLNKGSADGVKTGMAVRTDAGLVGSVYGASSNFAMVELIDNRGSRIACRAVKSGVEGILAWRGGTVFELKNIPKSFDVEAGETVLTSNYSGKFPEDVPVGRIIEVKNDPGETFLTVSVEPFSELHRLEEVFVIDELVDPERLKLVEEIEEKIERRKSGEF